MLWNTHMVAGLLATETYLYVTKYEISLENTPVMFGTLALSMVFATIPDADQRHSWAGKRMFPLSIMLSALNVKHRGLTHSILFTLLVWYLLTLTPLPTLCIIGAVIGYSSHWFIDMFNQTGIQIFYPLQKKIKFGTNIKVQSMGETIFQMGCVGLIFVVAFLYAQPYLIELGVTEKVNFFSRIFSI
jgi:inner membrane protein